LTPEYLKLVQFESISKNTKIFFGNSIPEMYSEMPYAASLKSEKNN
jgi:hypothetical protein